MSRSELPPEFVKVPVGLVYDQRLSGAVFQTYVQLLGLAWGKQESPTVSIDRLMELTGKGQSTLYGHMALLRSHGAFRWRPAAKGTLILSFEPVEGSIPCEEGGGGSRDSRDLERPFFKPPPHTYRSSKNYNDGESLGGVRGINVEGGLLKKHPPRDSGKLESPTPHQEDDPIGIYRSISRVKPNSSQHKMITAKVDDPDMWRETIEHWMAHGWNSRNVAGMLKLYQQGGPEACLFCQDPPEREPTQEEIFRELLEE
jgi:hypothetical protein